MLLLVPCRFLEQQHALHFSRDAVLWKPVAVAVAVAVAVVAVAYELVRRAVVAMTGSSWNSVLPVAVVEDALVV
jgi:hypothetical protein